jgi:hypothetical protein
VVENILGLGVVLSAMLLALTEAAYEPKIVDTLLPFITFVYAATLLVSPVRKATVVLTTTEPERMLSGTMATFTGPYSFSMFAVRVLMNCNRKKQVYVTPHWTSFEARGLIAQRQQVTTGLSQLVRCC